MDLLKYKYLKIIVKYSSWVNIITVVTFHHWSCSLYFYVHTNTKNNASQYYCWLDTNNMIWWCYLHCYIIGWVHFVSQQVISAQQLPKLNKKKEKSIVDPLVRVAIHGVPADNAQKETSYIENNGENKTPTWKHSDFFHTWSELHHLNIIHSCRVQPHVESEVPVWNQCTRPGHVAICGGGPWHSNPEWLHRAVLSAAHQCTAG